MVYPKAMIRFLVGSMMFPCLLACGGTSHDEGRQAIALAATQCKGQFGDGYVEAIADALGIQNTDLTSRWAEEFAVGEYGGMVFTSATSGAEAAYAAGAASCMLERLSFERIDVARVMDAFTISRGDGYITGDTASVSWQKLPNIIEVRIAPND